MRMTERVREIIEENTESHYIALAVQGDTTHIYPMYFARILENAIAFPVTNATEVSKQIHEGMPAMALVADRERGYEAYQLEGTVRYVDHDMDFELVAQMRNVVPGFAIHGAIVFDVTAVHLVPPP